MVKYHRSVPRSAAYVAIALILTLQLLTSDHDSEVDAYSKEELSELVVLDIMSFEYVSGGLNHSGISPWGSLYFGEVNETTKVSFKVVNNDGAPFKNVRVIFTVNWFDGVKSDTNYVIFRDTALLDVPAGKGSKVGPIVFRWIPQFAGSYMMNITIYVPNDRYPASEARYAYGLNYTTASNKTYWNGYWIGTYSHDCSDMDGWSTEVSGGLEGNNWHVSQHPLGKGENTLHTSGAVFWAGNGSSPHGPLSGVYSLISPVFDLAPFDDSAYNPEVSKGTPQIYFLYRYKGNVTSEGISGKAGLYHYISVDEGLTWDRLLDPLGRHIIIGGNTTSPIWDYPRHNTVLMSERWGIDLSQYQGNRIMLKLEYRPSGYTETGYFLDDFVLIGKERVDISNFKVVDHTKETLPARLGNPVDYRIDITSLSRDVAVTVRAEVVEAAIGVDRREDVRIEPMMIELDHERSPSATINVQFYPKGSLRAGPGWIKVRLMGENTIRDLTFQFMMAPVNDLNVELNGRLEGHITHNQVQQLYLYLNNSGNTEEKIHLDFGSDQGLRWNWSGPVNYLLRPGDRRIMDIRIDPGSDDTAGYREGFLIMYRQLTDVTGDRIPGIIREGETPTDWKVWHLNYNYIQSYNISLIASTRYALIRDPQRQGEENITFHLGLLNNGNGNDRVRLISEMNVVNANITIEHPEYIDVRARSMDTVIPVNVRISYPISPGLYRFRVYAISQGEEDKRDNYVDLSIRIGREEIPNGVYMMNSTFTIEPARAIVGSGSVISFEAMSYGLPDNTKFNVLLRGNGTILSINQFYTARGSSILCQITWIPLTRGQMVLTLEIEGSIERADIQLELVQRLNISIRVYHIDLAIAWHSLPVGGNKDVNGTVDPGTYLIEISMKNKGDVMAEFVTVNTNLTSDVGGSITTRMNVTRIEAGETIILRMGPFDLEPMRRYYFEVHVPKTGRWIDMDPEDNHITGSINVGESPPDEPIWRDPVFLLASSGALLLLFILIIVMIYRRK